MQTNLLKTIQQKNLPTETCILQELPPVTSFFGGVLNQTSKLQVATEPKLFLVANHSQAFYDFANQDLQNQQKLNAKEAEVNAVTNTVLHFLGGTNRKNNVERTSLYYKNSLNCPITAFYGKDSSECSERALAAHALFQAFGMESYLVNGPLMINGMQTQHVYNIIKQNNHYHIYDLACCPTVLQGNQIVKQPLVKQLSEEEVLRIGFEKEQFTVDLNEILLPVTFQTAKGNTYCAQYGTSYHKEQAFLQ